VIAHVAGLPAEEILASVAAWGAGLLAARAWVVARLRSHVS
jgi:hypothetical protein